MTKPCTPVHALLALFLAACLCACASAASAVEAAPTTAPAPAPLDHLPALKGGYFPLVSASTGRTHHVYVRLPEGYEAAGERRWPVVYVLDGDSLFPILAATHLFLGYDEGLPEAIIVGIAYGGFDPAINRRDLDFTGQGADTAPARRTGPSMTSRDQLLPEVEGRYRAEPARRVLVANRAAAFRAVVGLAGPDFLGRIASNRASRQRASCCTPSPRRTSAPISR